MSEERLPVHEMVKVISHRQIYKTKKWWCEVVLANMFGHDKVMVYQWQSKDGGQTWKRKQKFGINFEKDWIAIRAAIDEFVVQLRVVK